MRVRHVVFDSTLYLPEAVEAAVAAYHEHASIATGRTRKGTVASFEEAVDEAIVHAFCNHVLFETVTRRGRASLEGL